MKKKATCQVEFEFEWSEEDIKNPLADEFHFCELYLSSRLKDTKLITKIDVECVWMEDLDVE